MTPKYLVRFDDICPTMHWDIWSDVEKILIETRVKPILAVIPDNQDGSLEFAPPDSFFWEKVRSWQERGWTIGMHGYQHLYVTNDPGIIGLNTRSEFAGLPPGEQEGMMNQALAIFRAQGIHPDLWIAPAHSFDDTTTDLLKKFGIASISDGFYPFPHTDADGVFWLPQQLWRFRRLPFGVWTVCCHHNKWSKHDVTRFRTDMMRYRNDIADVPEIVSVFQGRQRTLADRLFSSLFLFSIQTKRFMSRRG